VKLLPALPGPQRTSSIRRSLLWWLLLPLVVLVPVAAALLYGLTVRPALDSLDRALSGTAVALANLLVDEGGRVRLTLNEQTALALRTDPYDRVWFAVTDGAGALLAGDAELAQHHAPLPARQWRFFDAQLHGEPVRVAAYGGPCGVGASCPVLVAESVGKRSEAQRRVLIGAALTMLLLAVALVVLGRIAVGRSLRPLLRLGRDIEHRSPENLHALDAAGVPEEAQTMVVALNHLLDRLRNASLAQQQFIADAAHQLRTPLAALQVDSELAMMEAHPPAVQATLQHLHASAARAARLAQQLLVLARAEDASHSTEREPVDLKVLCAELAQEWIRPAHTAGVDLGFELEPAMVSGRAFQLRELLGNLLHNTLEHAGRGAHVTVRCGVLEGRPVLEVEDNGPGIPGAERERVWQRFQRGPQAAGTGSGLGLAIVRHIALGHGAQAELREGAQGRGLCVRILFP
jgi:two-component system sensor histidine kinase TctE